MVDGQARRLTYTVLALDGWLPAPPAAVWPFISEPHRLNRWSSAPVQGLEPGDGGGFGTVGALRQVVLPRPLPVVTETIQHADAPTRFVYRAVGSRSVRYHRGELRLSAHGTGTKLRWEIGMALPVPGTAALLHRTLEPHLIASIRRLASVVEGAAEADLDDEVFQDDDDPQAETAADAAVAALARLADEMRARGDPRHWFSRVYQYVTEAIVDACAGGEVAHPTWALRLAPGFHALYVASLDGPAEPHWREAFDAIAGADRQGGSGALAFWRALVAGARAHIEGDLPRVLAATYGEHYAGRCDYERFRADFLLLAASLQRAWSRLAAEVPARWSPPSLRLLDRVLPPEVVEHLTANRFYDPLAARRAAFEAGGVLAAGARPSAEAPRPGTNPVNPVPHPVSEGISDG